MWTALLTGLLTGLSMCGPQALTTPEVWILGVPAGLEPSEVSSLAKAIQRRLEAWSPDLLVAEELLYPPLADGTDPAVAAKPEFESKLVSEPDWLLEARSGHWTLAVADCELSPEQQSQLGLPRLGSPQLLALELRAMAPLHVAAPRSPRFEQLWLRAQAKAKDLALLSRRHARGSEGWLAAEQRYGRLLEQLPDSHAVLMEEFGEDSRAAEVLAAFHPTLHPMPPPGAALIESFAFHQHPERLAVQRRLLRGTLALIATEGLGIELLAAAERTAVDLAQETIAQTRSGKHAKVLVIVASSRHAPTHDAFQRHGFSMREW